MADLGHTKTDKEIAKLEKKILEVYSQAEKDIEEKIDAYNRNFMIKDAIHKQELKEGKITKEEYGSWIKGQVFQGEQWVAKKKEIADTIYNANKVAVSMVNGQMNNVFAINANYMNYSLESGAGVNFGFGIYDSATVANLIKNDPELLPKRKVNAGKDKAWNNKIINNAVTQGIIQGEPLDKIAKRIAKTTENRNANSTLTVARTSMTSAQNAGREYSLKEAKKLGIKLYKEWMATLDARTRDSHAAVDGEKIPVGDKWHHYKFSNGCKYPGDPDAPPREIYNCRCTMVGDVEDYPDEYERYDNIEGKPIKNMSYKEWEKLKKQQKVMEELDLDNMQEAIDALKDSIDGMNFVLEGVWKNKVTLDDYEEKKDAIQGKLDYYDEQIDKYKKQFYDEIAPTDEEGKELYDLLSKHQLRADAKKDPKITELLEEFDFDEDDFDDVWTMFTDARQKIDIQEGLKKKTLEYKEYGEKYATKYAEMKAQLKDLQNQMQAAKQAAGMSAFSPDAYSQERKDAALWAKTQRAADKALRSRTGEVWRDASMEERDAIYEYTQSYHKYNEPLRGYEYGTSKFLGVGNTDLNADYANNGKRLNAMTDIIDKCSYDEDVWLQRGIRYDGADKFLEIPMELLENGTQKELEDALLGTTPIERAFCSCGSSKGGGFSNNPIMLNIYAPSGTKMMYVEPFSEYGRGTKSVDWDGVSTQSSFGSEIETILQQGTRFRITKVEKQNSILYLDMEIIDQSEQQRYGGTLESVNKTQYDSKDDGSVEQKLKQINNSTVNKMNSMFAAYKKKLGL